MNVLGIDTSTAVSSACVLRADGEEFDEGAPVDPDAPRAGHARDLLPAIDRALTRAGLGYPELDVVAAGVGPGGFTGLRIGLATAQGIAHAHGLELRRVSSLAALALGAEPAPGTDSVLALIDARRGELFAALYAASTRLGRVRADLVGEERLAPFAASPERVLERVAATGLRPLAAGDGSVRFKEFLQAAGIAVAQASSAAHLVHAASICRLATTALPEPPPALLPDYQRLPDAKPR